MIHGPNGSPTALYFLDPNDAQAMAQEFLQMDLGGQTVHVMATNFERALRQVTAPVNPTGHKNEDSGAVDLMEYRLVPSSRDKQMAKKIEQRKGGGESKAGSLFKKLTDSVSPSSSSSPSKSSPSDLTAPEIPVFAVTGLLDKSGGALLFLSYSDAVSAFRAAAGPDAAMDIEVFDLASLVKSMDDPNDSKAFDKVKFVASSDALNFVKTTSGKGNGLARLRPMR